MAPQSIWNGTISFGLAHVPIKLYSATESKTVSFHEVHVTRRRADRAQAALLQGGQGGPLQGGREGLRGDATDKFVVLDKDEIKAAAGARGKVIEIEEFVPDGRDRPDLLREDLLRRPRDDDEAYRVLHAALEQPAGSASAASPSTTASTSPPCARSTTCSRCTRCASTTRSSRPTTSTSTPRARARASRRSRWPSQLVESLHREFDPSDYEDSYREAVLELIERKAKGEEIEAARARARGGAGDLMAALQASLGKGS